MNLSLAGKTAIVCGSTQGIGKAAAFELAHLGANVILVARSEDKLKAVVLLSYFTFISVIFSRIDLLKSVI